MPFYSSVKYYGKYRTQNHFIAMIRTPLLNLLYKKKKPQKTKNNKTLKRNPNNPKTKKKKTPKQQNPKLQRSISSAGIKQHSIFEVVQILGC